MEPPNRVRTTDLLERAGRGDPGALADLFPVVYDEIRLLAGDLLRHERRDHTLQPTALAHEAWLRLVDESRLTWQGRPQFFALVAQAMRRILVEHARARRAEKRGGARTRVELGEDGPPAPPTAPADDLLDLDEALTRFSAVDARAARVVELRYFGGMSVEDVAALLGVTTRTVALDWAGARAWLRARLGP